jgi:hypothetical protein
MITAAALTLLAALPPGQLPELKYYGGRVISNVHVVPVFWGNNVESDTRTKIEGFYKAIVQDLGYGFDWLDEYNTMATTPSGTRQHIGVGTVQAPITIQPITPNRMSDNQIVAELRRQIALGPVAGLPPPDNPNVVYLLHFPPGTVITSGTATSCVEFCAYHDTVDKADTGLANHLLIGVIPDHGVGSGCETGCGGSKVAFENVTNSASHELIEIVTDPDVALTPDFAAPVAWIDPLPRDVDTDHLEIGDICAEPGDQATFTAADTKTYVVQKEWSNKYSPST